MAQQHYACILLISMHGCYPHLQGQAIRYGLQPHPLCHSQSAIDAAIRMQLAPRVAAEAQVEGIGAGDWVYAWASGAISITPCTAQ